MGATGTKDTRGTQMNLCATGSGRYPWHTNDLVRHRQREIPVAHAQPGTPPLSWVPVAHKPCAPPVGPYQWRNSGGAHMFATGSQIQCTTGRLFPTSVLPYLDLQLQDLPHHSLITIC